MPRLHDELVASLHVAEDNHFQVAFRIAFHWNHFSDGGHPGADQPFPTFFRSLSSEFWKILDWMISARGTVRKNRHGVKTFLCSDEGVPGEAPPLVLRVGGTLRRRRGFHALQIGIGGAIEQPVCEQVSASQTDIIETQTE